MYFLKKVFIRIPLINRIVKSKDEYFIRNKGYCNCCLKNVYFSSRNSWLRDYYVCENCGSIPRERALMKVIDTYYPNWQDLTIHESSPSYRGASKRIQDNCPNYIKSQYFGDSNLGTLQNGYLNINLERQNFPDEIFDLVITQDVLEHLYNPKAALQEIYRTLKPGGAHICTVPLVNKEKETQVCSVLENGQVKFLYEPEYHGNPIDPKGSPVSFHYGYDLGFMIAKWTKFLPMIIYIEDINYGIKAEYNEVIIMKKER